MNVGPLSVDDEALKALCEKWGIAELAVFGSVLREDFGPESDVDLLVSFRPSVRFRMLTFGEMEAEFSTLFGRRVEAVERAAVQENPNWIIRREILDSAQLLHVA